MNKITQIKNKLLKIVATWAAIGIALITINASGFIPISETIIKIFSANIAELIGIAIEAIFVTINALIVLFQAFRAIVIINDETIEEKDGEVLTKALGRDYSSYKYNPFAI